MLNTYRRSAEMRIVLNIVALAVAAVGVHFVIRDLRRWSATHHHEDAVPFIVEAEKREKFRLQAQRSRREYYSSLLEKERVYRQFIQRQNAMERERMKAIMRSFGYLDYEPPLYGWCGVLVLDPTWADIRVTESNIARLENKTFAEPAAGANAWNAPR